MGPALFLTLQTGVLLRQGHLMDFKESLPRATRSPTYSAPNLSLAGARRESTLQNISRDRDEGSLSEKANSLSYIQRAPE